MHMSPAFENDLTGPIGTDRTGGGVTVDGVTGRTAAETTVEPDVVASEWWPSLNASLGVVQLCRANVDASASVFRETIWHYEAGSDARDIYDYMSARPDRWQVWAGIARQLGSEVLAAAIVQPAITEADERAVSEAEAVAQERELAAKRNLIDLLILDHRDKRPALGLQSRDVGKPFFKMRFSEKWERERVVDWLRCQKHRFPEFRAFLDTHEALALEQLVMSGMRETEADVKSRGLSSGGRRPLRFWRGE